MQIKLLQIDKKIAMSIAGFICVGTPQLKNLNDEFRCKEPVRVNSQRTPETEEGISYLSLIHCSLTAWRKISETPWDIKQKISNIGIFSQLFFNFKGHKGEQTTEIQLFCKHYRSNQILYKSAKTRHNSGLIIRLMCCF